MGQSTRLVMLLLMLLLAAPASAQAMDVEQRNRSYEAFLLRLQAAVRVGDRRAVSALIRYPLRVNSSGHARYYRSATAVRRSYPLIFTARVRGAILAQRSRDLFVRDQGAMIGDGEVWFDHICMGRNCAARGPVRITAINR